MINIFKHEVNWKTVAYDEPLLNEINETLTVNLKIICRSIIKTFPKVQSIYLTQSFSRGEGSVLVENGKIKFLSDHDILVISDASSYILQLRKKQFEQNFSSHKLCDINVMHGHPIVDLNVMNIRQLRTLPPSLFKHELKTAACIYGRDLLEHLHKICPQKIPSTEGLSVLFNRMFGSLLPFYPRFLHSKLDEEQSKHLTFESVKLIAGCRDALLVIDNFFGLTEKEKQDYFKLNWWTKRCSFTRRFPEFLDISEKAYLYRIKPSREFEVEAVTLWFKSCRIASEVLRLYLCKLYGIKESNWLDMIDEFMVKTYYDYSYRLYTTFSSFLSKVKAQEVKISPRPNRILAALILLLFSVSENGIDKPMLETAGKIVGIDEYCIPQDNGEEIWTLLKDIVCANYAPPLTPQSSLFTKLQTLIAAVSLG